MTAGVEALNVYAGGASLDVRQLFEHRGLDLTRFTNLMMDQKSVGLPCEDTVTNAVNAARPLVDALPPAERDSIEAVVVGTESGLDYGKPVSTYVHDYLALSRRCRSFEVKHACYGGTAALRAGLGLLAASPVPGARALVIAADAGGDVQGMPYWEASHGAGAVAMLVGGRTDVLELDPGAAGLHTYEVMDTCRPRPDVASGDSDLSLLAYLECLEQSFAHYQEVVSGADIRATFDYLAFHTPFAGMVKGAHRHLLRRTAHLPPAQIEQDFADRVAPSLGYPARIGNTYSAGLFVAVCSLLENADFSRPRRIGLFSYGSGCASEFYSAVAGPAAPSVVAQFKLRERLDERYPLTMAEYDLLAGHAAQAAAGVAETTTDITPYAGIYEAVMSGRGLLALDRISGFRRHYRWT